MVNTELNSKEHELLLQKLKEENIYCNPDDAPRSITKPDGRVIELASFGAIKSAFSGGAQVLDVRDKNEVDANKGGTTVTTAVHAPVNINGESQ